MAVPQSCWVLTTDAPPFIITDASPEWQALWGYSKQEAAGKPLSAILHKVGFSDMAAGQVVARKAITGDDSATQCTNVARGGHVYSHKLTLTRVNGHLKGVSRSIELIPASLTDYYSAELHASLREAGERPMECSVDEALHLQPDASMAADISPEHSDLPEYYAEFSKRSLSQALARKAMRRASVDEAGQDPCDAEIDASYHIGSLCHFYEQAKLRAESQAALRREMSGASVDETELGPHAGDANEVDASYHLGSLCHWMAHESQRAASQAALRSSVKVCKVDDDAVEPPLGELAGSPLTA